MSVCGLLLEIFAPVPFPPAHLDRHWPWVGRMGERTKDFFLETTLPQKYFVCVCGGEEDTLSKSTAKVLSRADQDTGMSKRSPLVRQVDCFL